MKLLVDMNVAPRWVVFLDNMGFEASHWSAVGAPDADDAAILDHARANGLVLLTNDLDFSAILAASGGASPSVVQLRSGDLSPETIGPNVVAALRLRASELLAGAVLSVDEHKARLRMLPIA